jgi:apolipoprotein D and lipocalin family protein
MTNTPQSLLVTMITILFLSGCVGKPKGIEPIQDFTIKRYFGKWYEIARLDHSFERGLYAVTAEYSMRNDGGVKVLNSGKVIDKENRKTAEGRAYFVDEETLGHLKVSFFGPFFGSYIIFEIDKENYQYAFITSYNKSYLWFLSRTPEVSESLMKHFITRAKSLGFNTDQLIFVEHEEN